MQAVRSRTLSLFLRVQLYLEFGSRFFIKNIARTWFLFILSASSEVMAKCYCFTTSWDSLLNAGPVSTVYGRQYRSQYTCCWWSKHTPWYGDDKSCHSWYWMYIKNNSLCRSNSWGCCSCQSWHNVERFNIKYEKLPEISKDDNSRNTDILWKLSCLLYPTAPAWNGTYATGSSWGISWWIFNIFSANDRHGSYKWIMRISNATLCCKPGQDIWNDTGFNIWSAPLDEGTTQIWCWTLY